MDNCDSNAKCIDTEGSYNCSCNSGFFGNGTSGQCSGNHDDITIMLHENAENTLQTLTSVMKAVLAILMLPVTTRLVALSALATLATKEMDWTVQVSCDMG